MELDLGPITDLLAQNNITGEQVPLFLAALLVMAIFAIFIILQTIGFLTRRYFRKKNYLHEVVLQVLMPHYSGTEIKEGATAPKTQQELAEKISAMEQFFANLGGMPSQHGWKYFFVPRDDHFSFEIVMKDGLIYFYVACSPRMKDYFVDQITAQFPRALVEPIEDYNIFQPNSVILGKMLKFKREYIFPIKTYRKLETDSLNALTNSLSQMDKDSGAAIQFVARSANPAWHKWAEKAASAANQGKKLSKAITDTRGGFGLKKIFSFLGEIVNMLTTKAPKEGTAPKPENDYKLTQQEQEAIKGIEEKSAKSGFDVNIRLIISAPTQEKAKMYLDNLYNSFAQFNIYQNGNAFGPCKIGNRMFGKAHGQKKIIHDFIYRNFDERRSLLMNAEEITSVFHFPLSHTETPNIVWLLSKSAPAPSNVPKEGLLLGDNVYRGVVTPVYMARDERRRHLYVIGQTGTGKSKFLDSLIIQDIRNGEGCCYIDPLGDDVEFILSCVPKERADDVIIFDPSDYERPLALNMLEYDADKPEQKIFAVNEVFAIFDKLYDLKATGGPMFEQYMKNSCLLLMDDPESGSTLLEVTKVLADEDYRNYKLSKCTTQVVKDFWEKEAQKAGGEASLANMVPYITSKLTPFLANDLVRPIISQQKSTLNFREAMDNKKIILVKLSKGLIGDINANLLGMIVIGKLLMAALGRADMPEEQRNDFYLYIDEFQNFLTESINTILSEARKYRLCLTLANQLLGQLVINNDERIKKTIFGNVGSKAVFRIGVADAEEMTKEFAPVFNEYDFLNVPNRNLFIKLLVEGANPPPFSLRALNPFKLFNPNPELAKAIRELSRLKFGRDRAIIEAEVAERSKVTLAKTAGEDNEDLEDLFE